MMLREEMGGRIFLEEKSNLCLDILSLRGNEK